MSQSDLRRRRRLGNRHWRESHGDGVIRTELAFQPHEDKLYIETSQPNKRAILENNRKLAQLSGDHKDLARGLRIPEEDWPTVIIRWPNLVRGTQDERREALTQVMAAHPEWVIIRHTRRSFPVSGGTNAG